MTKFALINSDGTIQNVIIAEAVMSGLGVDFRDITNDPRPIDTTWVFRDGDFTAPIISFPQSMIEAFAAEEARSGRKLILPLPPHLSGSSNE